MARIAAAAVAVAALVAAGVTERAAVAASFAVLGHLHWLWIPATIVLEAASMAAFAIMLRRLLAAGAASVGLRPMLATAYAANALSVSVPLAGPQLATAFTFRRFTQQGADAPLAGWSLLAGGVVSTAAGVLVVGGGGLASGNILATAAAVPGGVLALAALIGVAAATRRPGLRDALERPAAWALRHGSALFRRPAGDPRQTIRAWADRLGSLQLPPSGWMTVTGLALANWLADAAVLAVAIHAAGAGVPWHELLLVYGSGIAAQSLNITPGGLGVTEGTLGLALVATGLHASQALAAVLLYRLASFWLVALAGWLVLLWLHQRKRAPRDTGTLKTAPLCTRSPLEQDSAMAADIGRSSRFSRSSSISRCASSVVVPGRTPPSISAWVTQLRSVSGLMPSCPATRASAPALVAGSRWASTAIRVARSRSSSGYFLVPP
jgi:uncharacterized membrane protein YbhN (UPF0104 family)